MYKENKENNVRKWLARSLKNYPRMLSAVCCDVIDSAQISKNVAVFNNALTTCVVKNAIKRDNFGNCDVSCPARS